MNRILRHCSRVEIDGKEFEINTDFSVWIEIEDLFFSKTEDSVSSAAKILALAYPVLPPRPQKAIEKILWFYSCGEEKREGGGTAALHKPRFNLKKDFGYIWAAFFGEFGIDLSVQGLHWWKFCTLLSALGEECRFSRIVAYRGMDTAAVKDPKLRRFYESMKKKYRLEDNRGDRERELETVLKLESLF